MPAMNCKHCHLAIKASFLSPSGFSHYPSGRLRCANTTDFFTIAQPEEADVAIQTLWSTTNDNVTINKVRITEPASGVDPWESFEVYCAPCDQLFDGLTEAEAKEVALEHWVA